MAQNQPMTRPGRRRVTNRTSGLSDECGPPFGIHSQGPVSAKTRARLDVPAPLAPHLSGRLRGSDWGQAKPLREVPQVSFTSRCQLCLAEGTSGALPGRPEIPSFTALEIPLAMTDAGPKILLDAVRAGAAPTTPVGLLKVSLLASRPKSASRQDGVRLGGYVPPPLPPPPFPLYVPSRVPGH